MELTKEVKKEVCERELMYGEESVEDFTRILNEKWKELDSLASDISDIDYDWFIFKEFLDADDPKRVQFNKQLKEATDIAGRIQQVSFLD